MKVNVIGELLGRGSLFAEANFTYKWGVKNKKMLEGLILDKENHYEAIPVFLALLNSEKFASKYCLKKYEHIGCKTTLRYFTWFTKKDGFMLFVREYGKEESVFKIKKTCSLSDFSFRRSYDLMSELERGLGRELTAGEVNRVVELFLEEVQNTTKYNDLIYARMMKENFIGSFLTVLNMGVLLDKTYKKNKKKMIDVLVEYDWGHKMSINYAMAFAQSMGGQLTKHQILTWIRTNNFKKRRWRSLRWRDFSPLLRFFFVLVFWSGLVVVAAKPPPNLYFLLVTKILLNFLHNLLFFLLWSELKNGIILITFYF